LLFLQKLPTDDCIARVSTDWEDTATVIFSKVRAETNFGVLHNPESRIYKNESLDVLQERSLDG